MYMKMFGAAAELENPVCAPGMIYLRCLKENRTETHARRTEICRQKFEAFDAARKALLMQQEDATEKALVEQNIADLRAKSLFERRLHLLSLLEAANAAAAAAATAAAAAAAAAATIFVYLHLTILFVLGAAAAAGELAAAAAAGDLAAALEALAAAAAALAAAAAAALAAAAAAFLLQWHLPSNIYFLICL
ncbi:hypothetical protein, conserved [Eimeria maxima]|uniref:Uncharacterized protein n=1 Tax=Eimeria maxima TaxID=5804 RepID=U6M5V7_EIMMA|nr:hypothetical protein, conserved [Eimeria maxima]CDJ57854.1 hypothetical protein, conserved [Eimeria maxima]